MRPTRRDLLAAGAVGLAGLAGCLGPGGDGGTPTPNPPDGAVANAPLPDAPDERTYATMGDPSAPVVTYFGNWKCPYCAQFSTGEGEVFPLSRVVTDYVEPGDLALRYRALSYDSQGNPFLGPDAPRAARAGLSVWNVDPDSYWPYHEYVFAHQPSEGKRWATVDRLVEFAHLAGVADVPEARDAIESGQYEQAVKANTDAATEAGIGGTPNLVAGDRVVSPFEPDETKQALDALADGS